MTGDSVPLGAARGTELRGGPEPGRGDRALGLVVNPPAEPRALGERELLALFREAAGPQRKWPEMWRN